MSDDRWLEKGRSPHPHEAEALEFLRQGLPDHDPWRGWARLQFAALDGSENEVDALVFGKTGLFLIEIKSWEGRIEGDQGTLIYGSSGHRKEAEHPVRLLKLKCERLKALLLRQPAMKKVDLPFIEPLLFLSHAESHALDVPASNGVCLRDRPAKESRNERSGILAALLRREGANLRPRIPDGCDRPTMKAIVKALEEAGVAPRAASRRIEGFELGETLEETSYYRDRLGTAVTGPKVQRRVRIYCAPTGSTLSREQIEAAAEREFRTLERLDHPAILRAREWKATEHGPAILFDYLPKAQRLDRFMAQHGAALGADQRLDLLRQIADAIAYAHRQRILHRGLSPQSILVVDPDQRPLRVKVYNWQGGAREGTDSRTVHSTLSFHSTSDPVAYLDDEAALYAAPEMRDDPNRRGSVVDIFSLGSIAFLLFSGRAPASSWTELIQTLRREQGLSLSAVSDSTLPSLERVIRNATHPEPSRRTESVETFLAQLEDFEDEFTRPAGPEVESPEDAVKGMTLACGLVLEKRLGTGSIAVAFQVKRGNDAFVLKWARSALHNDRIGREIDAVKKLDHDNIVRFVDEINELSCRGFLVRPTSLETLRQRLTQEGQLQLEMLERFGSQLLEALVHLEARGVTHRDIKPDNIGITDFGRRQQQGIVLFDFSLSATPPTDLRAGTPKYVDPFLSDRPNRRWDLHAERYSAALTLYEMATGSLPRWGDGMVSPSVFDGDVTIEPDLFGAEVRSGLLRFFQKALQRNPKDRFADSDAMLAGWKRALAGELETARTTREPLSPEASKDEILAAVKAAGPNTPLISIPLSTRATNSLERLGLNSVKDLLRRPPREFLWARGVGKKTRDELDNLQLVLREKFPDVEIDASTSPAPSNEATASDGQLFDVRLSIEALVARAVKSVGAVVAGQEIALETLLGLHPPKGEQEPDLPTQVEVARRKILDQPKLSLILKKARARWSADAELKALCDEVAVCLAREGNVATAGELAAAIMAVRTSDETEPSRTRKAGALVRIACETEDQKPEPRFALARRQVHLLVTASDALADYAVDLGRHADVLVARRELPSLARVELELAGFARRGVDAVPPPRAVRLAAACSRSAAVNARGELYPKNLAPDRAVRLSVNALSGLGRKGPKESRRYLDESGVRQRIQERYPEAAPLPERLDLERLLREAGLDVDWDESQSSWTVRAAESRSIQSASSVLYRYPTLQAVGTAKPQDVSIAVEFDERVARAIDHQRFVVITAPPAYVERAIANLTRTFPQLNHVDLERELITSVRSLAAQKSVALATVFAADATGSSNRSSWERVVRVMGDGLAPVRARLLASEMPVLLTGIGLLVRYGKLNLLTDLSNAAGANHPGTIVLIPGDMQTATPRLDGVAIPALISQHAYAPDPWLQNLHRAAPSARADR